MSSRRATAAIAVATTLAVAARAAFLYWSPLPATLDGFRYASLAAETVAAGRLPVPGIGADELVTTALLAVASDLTGVRPLYLAQPLVAVLGGIAALSGYVVVRSVGRAGGWLPARIRLAGALAVAALAVEGLFLRRTGVPDEEALGLLLLPLVAFSIHRTLADRQWRWAVVAAVFLVAYPPLHNFSGIAAAFVATALAAAHVARRSDARTAALAVALVGGYWAYFFGYYAAASRLGLSLTYAGLVRDHPGTLLAWVVVVAVVAAWFRVASARARRAAFAVPLCSFFAVVAVNAVRPVFPGTLTTPPLVLALVAVYAAPMALFVVGVPRVGRGETIPALALLVGPAALILFTLTTSLSPQFFGAAMRAQTFGHVGAIGVAVVAAVAVAVDRPRLGRAAVAALLVAALLTAPLAFIHLDTATAPRTVHESEFSAASFAALHTPGAYTSDQRLATVGPLYHRETAATVGPTRAWLYGGPPPDCATLAQRGWTTDGAHFYPTRPARLAPAAYARWKRSVDVIYVTDGRTETVLGNPGGC